jgi:uncharacterized protein
MHAADLLRLHLATLVDEPARWRELIADDLVWELAYAPALGHPARLSGRAEVERHAAWFAEAVDDFRFFDLEIHPFADPAGAVADVKAEGRIRATGRAYRQHYVVFLRAHDDRIVFMREFFDPTRASYALDAPLRELGAWS